ncbi:MAG: hypothetical protein PGN23_11135 [Sphingomonas adhaesiva]|uniref:hypothetical protein n=1 Tax=Sphingomonas adhaesiva TaxID=28212 RepID=UPI002FFA8980
MLIKNRAQAERVRSECYKLVTRRAIVSAATGAIPFAAAGATSDVLNLTTLLPKINAKFGLDPDQIDGLDEQVKEQIAVIAGRIGTQLIGKLITETAIVAILRQVGVRVAVKSAASFVPVVGNTVSAGMSFGMMKLVGNRHVDDCFRLVTELLDDQESIVSVPAAGA